MSEFQMSEFQSDMANVADTATVLGVPVHKMTMREVLDHVRATVVERGRLRIGMVNAAKLVNMSNDSELDVDVRTSDLVLADGMSVVWASKVCGTRLNERIAGIDLMHEMMRDGAASGMRVFMLGAHEEVNEIVAQQALKDYPGIAIAGRRNGYFEDCDEPDIVDQINQSQADVLFVAITSPKKERFMGRWKERLNVPVIHGVGGSFDVYAGKVSRAPQWMQRAGLEWLHRVAQEPSRMWRRYLITNTIFVWRVVKERLSGSDSMR